MDESLHLIMHAAREQIGDFRAALAGRITAYDPQTHRVRVQAQALSPAAGQPQSETTWIPLGTIAVGRGSGVQIGPHPGTSDSTTGDQCIVILTEETTGAGAVALLMYDDVNTVIDPALKSGEIAIKHDSGNYIRLNNDKSVNIVGQASASVVIDPTGNIKIQTGAGIITITNTAGSEVVLNGKNALVQQGEDGSGAGQIRLGATALAAVARLGDQVTVGGTTGTITSASSTVFAQ